MYLLLGIGAAPHAVPMGVAREIRGAFATLAGARDPVRRGAGCITR